MATRIKNGYDPRGAIDSLILKSLEEKLETQLRQAYSDIEYVHGELKVLSMGKDLPKAYKAAYARLRDVAALPLRVLHEAKKKQISEWQGFDPVELDMPPPAWIDRAKQVLEQINAVDLELEASLSEARDVLLKGQSNAIFDWAMPASVKVTLTLNHGPKRSIYDHIDEEYVGDGKCRIRVGCEYSPGMNNGEVENWSEFGDPDHPLFSGVCRMTYLSHCIVHHLPLPWELLPCIDEIEATLEFHDYQTIWPVANREVRICRVIEE
ncbi:hypothetical protein [Rhodanobacter umsongensis]